MKEYGILINSQTGKPVYNTGFQESEIPPEDILPTGTEVVRFSETTDNFELLYALFFTDPNRLSVEYKQPTNGGVIYDIITKTFSFYKQDFTLKLEELQKVRNQLLINTDKYMLVPDLPQDIRADLLAYRAQLRNITSKLGTEWNTIFDVQWPEFPQKLIVKPVVPPEVA
jgi:hypothetical protein